MECILKSRSGEIIRKSTAQRTSDGYETYSTYFDKTTLSKKRY